MKDTKRRWVFQTKRFCAFKEQNHYSCCAICRCRVDHYCTDCRKRINNLDQGTTIDQMSMLLLCMKNRKDCLFNKLDIHLLCKMLEYILWPKKMEKCRIATLECGHIYHRHCFEKWAKKCQVCPLDNTPQLIPIKIQDIDRYKIKYKILYITKVPKKSRFYIKKEEKDRIRSWIVRQLKHHKPGHKLQDLYQIVCKKWYNVPIKLFKKCVETLIEREFIRRIPNDHKHLVYIP